MKSIKHFEDIEKKLKTPLTDKDVDFYLGQGHIMKYNELNKITSIYDILPEHKSFKIILLESDKNSGHWFALLRYNNNIEVFNSYGTKIENEFKFIPGFIQKMLDENKKALYDLLMNSNNEDEIIYNHDALQSTKKDIATCGRWCVMRILYMRDYEYTLEEFLDYIYDLHKQTKKPLDIIVCDFIKK